MRTLLLSLAALLAAVPSTLDAATWHVRPGGTGNGTTWTAAFGSASAAEAVAARGDTIYLAAGSVGSLAFNTAVNGSLWITFKKATIADHGSSVGWNDSYATGQAVLSAATTPLSIESNYFVIDGATGAGDSGHGIRIEVTGTGDATRGVRITATSNVVIQGCEITSTNPAGVADAAKQDGIYTTACSNLTILDCFIHNWKRCGVLVSGVTNVLIEGCYFRDTYSTSGAHGQAVQLGPGACSNVTIRYSTFKDCHGTGFIVYLDNTFTNIDTYGCVFWSTEPAAIGNSYTSQAIGSTAGDTANDCDVFNNTFVNLNGRAAAGAIDHNDSGTGNDASNNVWINSNAGFDSATGHNHNAYYNSGGTYGEANAQALLGDPFVSTATGNFHLAAATAAGATLSSTYAVDPDGITRGADGTWDRGAYEFSSGAADTTQPTVTITGPTSSATYSTSTTPVTLSGTASDNVGVASVTWVNAAGGSGTATGTTSWSFSAALTPGANAITVTAHDAAGNTGTDTITITYTPPAGGEISVGTANVQVITVSP